ncbi:MAG: extracellular solute-binding protein [Ruminococcaceae bacterium]|nr:extracellular solute-binding protein [Oscillospiraceae bacterium]
MATIKDVAKEAGVSTATVSNFINKTKPVRRDKAARITEAIAKLGYVPNQMARSLRRPGGKVIGVVLPNMQDQYYVQILEGIEQYFTAHNYFVSLGVSGESAEQEKKYISHFLENQAAGIICVSCATTAGDFYNNHLQKSGVPLVCLDRQIEQVQAPFLHFDNKKTMAGLTRSCLSDGRKKIVLLCGPSTYRCERDAEEGFWEALAEAGIPKDNGTVLHTALNKEAAFRAMLLHVKRTRPDAVLATSKPVAAGIIESLSVVGLFPGNDVMVGTFGEDNWSRQHDRPEVLYSARQAITMGKEAGKTLHGLIQNPQKDCKELVLEDVWTRIPRDEALPIPSVYKGTTLKALMVDNQQVELFSGLVPHFTNHTGIKVDILRLEEHEMLSRLKEPEQSTDVVMFDMPWLYSLANSGTLADITPFMQDFDESIYLNNCLDHYGKFRNRYYGLPYTYAPQILFYRRDLFANPVLKKQYFSLYNEELRPPKTWSEFNRVAAFFDKKQNPASPVTYGTLLPTAYKECLLPEVYMRMRAYGGEVYNNRFRVIFGSSQTIKALSALAALSDQSSATQKKVNDKQAAEAFLRGETAMQITYPSYLSDTADIRRGPAVGTTGYTHIPGKSPILGGWSLGVHSNSNHKEAAFTFVKWACGEYMANYSAILAGQSAIRSSFENNELISLYPWLPLYRDIYGNAEPILPPHKPGREIIPQEAVDEIIAKGVYELLFEDKTPIAATADIHEALLDLFRQYRY